MHVAGIDLARRVIPRLLVIAVGVQEIVTVAAGPVQHVLGDGQHIAVDRAALHFLGAGRTRRQHQHGTRNDGANGTK